VFTVIVWDNLVWVHTDFEERFVALRMISVCFPLENCFELHIDDSIYWFNYVIFVESVSTSESMIPRPCFQALYTVFFQFCFMFACSDIYFRLHLLLIIITTTCILLSLRRTSAPIHLASVLGVLGTQETFCIVIAGLLERDSFDLFLPEFDKPWVIHLRETCCCSTNLCTWRPNTVYKNRCVLRHQAPFWRRCRGGKVKSTHILWLLSLLVVGECSELFPLNSVIISFCFLFLFSLVRLNGK
jgi:hypothetical protein